MVEVEAQVVIDLITRCEKCGQDLEGLFQTSSTGYDYIEVQPCENCIAEAIKYVMYDK